MYLQANSIRLCAKGQDFKKMEMMWSFSIIFAFYKYFLHFALSYEIHSVAFACQDVSGRINLSWHVCTLDVFLSGTAIKRNIGQS